MTEIDPYPVSELQNRYSIGKQAVYNRLEALDIKPTKQGNKSYITLEQLQSLDNLHSHLQSGGTMADFQSPKTESAISPVDKSSVYSGLSQVENFVDLVSAIAAVMKPPADPLAHLENLERAANKGWLLSSSEVEQIIGVKPSCKNGSDTFTRGSFTFTKAGKIGNQAAWRVGKL